MKLRVFSDLHLEGLSFYETAQLADELCSLGDDTDVLVLAGDIAPANHKNLPEFLSLLNNCFRHILWVPGNHEYYHQEFNEAWNRMRDLTREYANVFLLDNEMFVHEGFAFIGATLWSDFYDGNIISMMECQHYINDYHRITVDGAKLTPKTVMRIHQLEKKLLYSNLDVAEAAGLTPVVVTHHAPCSLSINKKYKSGAWVHLNGAYFSDQFDAIHDRDIALWVHGHTHDSSDYDINGTRVYSNPRGYKFEKNIGYSTEGLIEL